MWLHFDQSKPTSNPISKGVRKEHKGVLYYYFYYFSALADRTYSIILRELQAIHSTLGPRSSSLSLSSWYQIAHGNRKEMWRILVCVYIHASITSSIILLLTGVSLSLLLCLARQKLHPWGMALFHARRAQDPSCWEKMGFTFGLCGVAATVQPQVIWEMRPLPETVHAQKHATFVIVDYSEHSALLWFDAKKSDSLFSRELFGLRADLSRASFYVNNASHSGWFHNARMEGKKHLAWMLP